MSETRGVGLCNGLPISQKSVTTKWNSFTQYLLEDGPWGQWEQPATATIGRSGNVRGGELTIPKEKIPFMRKEG